jgi:hypothetical protein
MYHHTLSPYSPLMRRRESVPPPSPSAEPVVTGVKDYDWDIGDLVIRLESCIASCTSVPHICESGIGGVTRDITLTSPIDIYALPESPLVIAGRESRVCDALDHCIPTIWGDFSSTLFLGSLKACVVLSTSLSPYIVMDGLLEKLAVSSGALIAVHASPLPQPRKTA